MGDGGDIAHFADIDQSGDPDYFATLLARGHACPGSDETRTTARARLRLVAGHTVLDAGCGPGHEAVELARLVGRSGRTFGVDFSHAMLVRARSHAEGQGLPVQFSVGDAQHLPFPDQTFDACRAASLLICVADAARALAELARVVKPGGRVVVLDSDNDTLFVDSPYPEITRTIVHAVTDSEHNGAIGRRLPALFREQGLADVDIWTGVVLFDFALTRLFLEGVAARAEQAGMLKADDTARWWESLRDADAAGTFTAGKTVFVVSGTRR
jgi:SAM-dependent methyltransferase